MFQLGFFSPVNDSEIAYIGIWYYNLPPRKNKVVWVANRNKYVDTSMASLNLTSDGNLVLFEEGAKVWSTGTSAELYSACLQLLDSGNLMLTTGNSDRARWESFDHASDNLLPGMKLGFNFRTNTSWQEIWFNASGTRAKKAATFILQQQDSMASEKNFVQLAIPHFDGHYDHWSMLTKNFLRSKEY
ncbi:hypothetical protein ZIOFF_011159 [Zingiber officinale]|uniref:Bulb-type lectin domain-containing protein n=1 Tax=Zingiber officinale TaxID=94328 RepID=A0A8J5I3L2_ZINOF|nr:hypothetical protein ZIOFF_011159 [Zingiber officinale]